MITLYRQSRNIAVAASVILLVSASVSLTSAQEKLGKVQQGLVGGQTVPVERQEDFGLLILNAPGPFCSAVLLRNDWAMTAAHCVETEDDKGNPIADPARPGQNNVYSTSSFTLKANWGGDPKKPGQTKKAVRLETLRPSDIALIKVDSPFTMHGSTSGYNCPVWKDQYPYFGQLVPINIAVFGRGYNRFAINNTMPSTSDGLYRVGFGKTTREAKEADGNYLYWYPSEGGQMVAGGDSGGPSFAQLPSGYYVLMGIHSQTHVEYVTGAPSKDWNWVARTPEAADAPVKLVWDKVLQIIGPMPAADSTTTTEASAFTGRHSAVFENTVPFNTSVSGDFNILYGVKEDGSLVWHRHIMTGPNFQPPTPGSKPVRVTGSRSSLHSWNPPQPVGTGWASGNRDVLPAGQQAIYVIKDNGELMRFWHSGAFEGTSKWGDGPQKIGSGWAGPLIIPSDNGVVYTITEDGILHWYQNPHYADSSGSPGGWAPAMKVGRGWSGNDKVFSGGNGVLYVVTKEGKLMWFRHKAYLNPVPMPEAGATNAQQVAWQNSWEGPKEVGTGWSGWAKLFSPGNGHIYGVMPNGDLKWYRHLGWQTGTFNWDPNGGVRIATGWDSYIFAFARTTGSDPRAGSGVQ